MALEIRQHLKQDLRLSQELVMTPQLQQAIKLLQLSRLELVDQVQEELAENPLLEEVKPDDEIEEPEAGASDDTSVAEAEKPEEREDAQEIDWEQYLAYYDVGGSPDAPIDSGDEWPSYENYLSPDTTLQDHLLWQLRLSHLSLEAKRIGALIVGNVDDDGYLRASVEEVADMAGESVEAVEQVLAQVQEFDPLGVASRNLTECLLRQARDQDLDDLVCRVIEQGLKGLETKNYKKLAEQMGASFDEVVDAAKQVASLEPRPGRNFASTRVEYVVPDVYVVKEGDDYVVRLNEDGVPRLRVSPYYQNLLRDKSAQGKEAKGYIQERMQAALWLIKSIHQRQQTLYKVACSIVAFQREFFDKGINHMRPLILKDVADDIGMHESTVSRVTTSKYMHTSRGTLELKFFFSSGIQSQDGGDLASRSVKARIREIVGREEPLEPLSDLAIARLLTEYHGLKIARRTVSKYREAMGILPSSSRKRYF